MLYAVIMAGGSGTRFWPESRASHPKQFLSFGAGRPLAEEALDRVADLVPPERIMVMTGAAYVDVMRDLLPELPAENFIGEPVGRDTSACIGLAAALLVKRDPGAVMAVMPSDHLIRPKELFCSSLSAADSFLKTHPRILVTFGIEPSRPATGYGYIKKEKELFRGGGTAFFEVGAFREKPDPATAASFLREGGYLWNSGVFVWRADTILDLIEKFLPGLHGKLLLLADDAWGEGFAGILEAVYPTLEKISIDYGVMERAPERAVAEVRYSWDDVGSWSALERLLPSDEQGNHVQGEFKGLGAANLVVSARGGMVAAVGVEGLIIVHTPDATLVCRKEDAESVKKIVAELAKEYR